jgi:uncharacterized protein
MKKLLTVLGFLLSAFITQAQDITGTWMGKLNVGTELRIVFHINQQNDTLIATMDSPDQGSFGNPTGPTVFENNELIINMTAINGSYKGTYNKNDNQFSGFWIQGANKLPLVLNKVDSVAPVSRPQTPKAPFPYKSEEVVFQNFEAENVMLAGTLTIPEGKGPFNAVILVSGSGPQNRNEELLAHQPFLVLSDYFTRNGIIVLRYDDRGVGASTGDFSSSTSMDFASDASAAVNYLKSRTDLPINKIGIAGHSEGGLIAPLTASENKNVGFIVMLAGPGIPGDSILYLQGDLIARASGLSDKSVEAYNELRLQLMEVAKNEIDADMMRKKMIDTNKAFLANTPKSILKELDMTEDDVEEGLDAYTSEWMQFFMTYDPRPTLEQITIPVLAVNGTTDLQVPYKQNLDGIEKALTKAGNKQFKIVALENLNHLFQTSETGNPVEYSTIEETFNQKAMQLIGDWIKAVK